MEISTVIVLMRRTIQSNLVRWSLIRDIVRAIKHGAIGTYELFLTSITGIHTRKLLFLRILKGCEIVFHHFTTAINDSLG